MAMNAKQAAELIRNGNFNDADELYDALNGQKSTAPNLPGCFSTSKPK